MPFMNSNMNTNTNTYVIAVDNTSKSLTFVDGDVISRKVYVYNGSTNPTFVVTGATAAPTAVFPTSATAPLAGKVVPPGWTIVFDKNENHKYLAAIQASAGTGSLYVSVAN